MRGWELEMYKFWRGYLLPRLCLLAVVVIPYFINRMIATDAFSHYHMIIFFIVAVLLVFVLIAICLYWHAIGVIKKNGMNIQEFNQLTEEEKYKILQRIRWV